MSEIVRHIDFSKEIKIEVGSGGNPQEGYVHADMNIEAPHVEIQYVMGDEELPVPKSCATEILSNHSIEHISWLKLTQVMQDWFRVLVPGGKVFIRTPDLEYICQKYLENKLSKESPVDEGNMLEQFGDYTRGEWANIKLFAGQDYPGNTHLLCLDFDMCKRLLEKNGFINVTRVNVQPIFSPGELQLIAFKPGH